MIRYTAPPDPFHLRPARVHEAGGRGRRAFALFQAARLGGAVIWVLPAHLAEHPLPAGLPEGVKARLHLVRPDNETDMLWCIEESLRSPAAALVIAEPQHALSLTVGRRLQLAAEAGQTLGLLLIGPKGGSNATETRWDCEPAAGPGDAPQGASPKTDSTLHRWAVTKNKMGTLGEWILNWDGTTAAFDLVSAMGKRHQPSPSPG
jgi:protein ImuA